MREGGKEGNRQTETDCLLHIGDSVLVCVDEHEMSRFFCIQAIGNEPF